MSIVWIEFQKNNDFILNKKNNTLNKLLLLLFCFSISQISSQQSHKFFDSLANDLISRTTIPSVVFSYITPDTCLYGIAGINNINDREKVKLTDKYHLGSNTKAITSLIAMKMVENGQIMLETKLLDVIPSLKRKIKKTYRKITLGELLSHRAWIRPYTAGLEINSVPELQGNLIDQRIVFLEHVLNQEAVPSETFTYSNAGYVIASHMLEVVAQKSYEELVDDFMKEMGYGYCFGFANKQDADAPAGHLMENEQWVVIGPDHEYKLPDFMNACGNLSMNIIDYAQLIQMQLNGLNGDDTYISSNQMKTLHFGLEDYAYGWIHLTNGKKNISTHDGTISVFHCHTIIIPGLPAAFIFFINSAEQDHVTEMYKLRDYVVKEMLK